MRALKIIGGFVLGLVIGEAIPIIWYIVATSYFGMFDRDGGGAMGAIFIMGPLLALILGIGFSIFVGMRTRAKAV
mgnify:CR=1 FL=1|jgi:hypothetical protein